MKQECGRFLSCFGSGKKKKELRAAKSLFTSASPCMRLCSGLPPISTLAYHATPSSHSSPFSLQIIKVFACVSQVISNKPFIFLTSLKQLEDRDSPDDIMSVPLQHPKFIPVLLTECSSVCQICRSVFMIYTMAVNSEKCSVWSCSPLCIRNENAGLRRFILHPTAVIVYALLFF